MKILIAGEAEALCQFLRLGLERDAYDVQCLRGAEAVRAVRAQPPDLLILDLQAPDPPVPELPIPELPLPDGPVPDLPDAEGVEPVRQTSDPLDSSLSPTEMGARMVTDFRSANSDVPMLVLTAGREVEGRVMCLDRGADDCMIKPLSLSELRARCRALLRRRADASVVLRWEGLELNRMSHRVEHDGRSVALTPTEFAVLETLMMHRGSCVSRETLLTQAWGGDARVGDALVEGNIVDVYINYLRRKLGGGRVVPLIQTVRGRGYRVGAALAFGGPAPGGPAPATSSFN